MPSPTIIKKSPIVIVKNFLILQIGAVLAFFGASSLAYYAQIYRALPVSRLLSFHIAEVLFVFFVEIGLIFFIFFRWYKEYVLIKSDKVVHGKGILYRKHATIPLSEIHSVTYQQGPLGRLTRYGTVHIEDAGSRQSMALSDMSQPQDFVEHILELKRTMPAATVYLGQVPDVAKLAMQGEHEGLEFKSTFRWDLRQQKVNKDLEKSVMKTVAAFLNSRGGHIVIGVDDKNEVIGLAADIASLQKQNQDGFENHFTNIFSAMIGPEFRQFIKLTHATLDGKPCCVVSVAPAHQPAYVRTDANEEFYIRTGNGTTSLRFSEASSYINTRFHAVR